MGDPERPCEVRNTERGQRGGKEGTREESEVKEGTGREGKAEDTDE